MFDANCRSIKLRGVNISNQLTCICFYCNLILRRPVIVENPNFYLIINVKGEHKCL